MINDNKHSTEYDIILTNTKFNEIATRESVYKQHTGLWEELIDDGFNTAEIKTTHISTLRQNGNFFIEHSMRIHGYPNFLPSGISVTTSEFIILSIQNEDETLFPIILTIKTSWLRDKIVNGLREGWVYDITTEPLKTTKDVNKGYVINIAVLLKELLELNTKVQHKFWSDKIESDISSREDQKKSEGLQRMNEIQKKRRDTIPKI